MIIANIVPDNIEEASTVLFQWFHNNLLKNNPYKFHLLISSNEHEIQNSECEKLLKVKLDWRVSYDEHISNRCKKAREELNALVRIAPFIGLCKKDVY